MPGGSFSPSESGYVEVKDRIEKFYERYPEGSIQSEVVYQDEGLIIMKGMAFRTPDDPRPGIGHSQMPIPGKTPYTRDSEVENAETSAWGRAIAALGFEVKRSIASAEEVEMKKGGGESEPTREDSAPVSGAARSSTPAQRRMILVRGKKLFGTEDKVREFVYDTVNKRKASDLTNDDVQALVKAYDSVESDLAAALAAAGGDESYTGKAEDSDGE